jgi:hypothetical protein
MDDGEDDVTGHSHLKGQERGNFPRGGHERGYNVRISEDDDVSGHSQLRGHERGNFPRGDQER